MKRLILILTLLLTLQSFGKVTPGKVVRVASSTTTFDETIPRGTVIYDATTGKAYMAYLGLLGTKTIATCTLNSDIVEITNPIPSAGIVTSNGAALSSIPDYSGYWTTAYNWGNHAAYGYATQSYVGTYYLPLSGGTLTGTLYGTSASFNSTVTGSNFILSDARLKENINPVPGADIAKYAEIIFHQFTFKADPQKATHIGVIAQEVEKIVPQFVNTDKEGMKSVNYIELLTAIVVQQRDAIQKLENRISDLENNPFCKMPKIEIPGVVPYVVTPVNGNQP